MKKKRHVWSGKECYLAAGKQTGHHSHQNCNLLLLDINTLLQAKPTIDFLYMCKLQFVIDHPQSLFNLVPQESQMPSWIGLCLQRNMISLWNKSFLQSEAVSEPPSIVKEGFRHFLMKTSCSTSTSLYVGGIITNKPFPRSLVHKRWLNLAPYFFCSCYQRLTTLVFLSEANPTINSFNGFHFPSRLLS